MKLMKSEIKALRECLAVPAGTYTRMPRTMQKMESKGLTKAVENEEVWTLDLPAFARHGTWVVTEYGEAVLREVQDG